MRNSALVFFSGIIILSSCFMGKRMIKLGDCPLSITVMAEEKDFDGFADVYLNERFIGTTDTPSFPGSALGSALRAVRGQIPRWARNP